VGGCLPLERIESGRRHDRDVDEQRSFAFAQMPAALERRVLSKVREFDQCEQAGLVRMRPFMMTTAAIAFGMPPMALALDEGGEIQAPMGRAIIGGVVASTLLTLIVVPVLYSDLDQLAAWARRRWGSSQGSGGGWRDAGGHARGEGVTACLLLVVNRPRYQVKIKQEMLGLQGKSMKVSIQRSRHNDACDRETRAPVTN
jgi:hypothetical protein